MLCKLDFLSTITIFFFVKIILASDSDITYNVFGKLTDGMPAAFGDFNSDELTDIFVLRDNGTTMEIFLSAEEEPLLQSRKLKCSFKDRITSVVPGDFDGDALMDVLVTTIHRRTGNEANDDRNDVDANGRALTKVYILWGGANVLNCTDEPILRMVGQPLAIDYNQDMIVDLFGVDHDRDKRTFWVFNNKTRGEFQVIPMDDGIRKEAEIQQPHAHAFLDLNDDNTADLFVTTTKNFEVWYGHEQDPKFVFSHAIPHPRDAVVIGQSLFIDVELRRRMDLVTPVCLTEDCRNSALYVYCDGSWHDLGVNFKEGVLGSGNAGNTASTKIWGYHLNSGSRYTNTITLHSGDFNMDGYPDLLATLSMGNIIESFLLENVPCNNDCGNFTRSYEIRWNALVPFRKTGTVMATFFDFYQNGILDVILVQKNGTVYKAAAFKNTLDYDANFIKVMVLTGRPNNNNAMISGRIGKKRKTYGTNLPGPKISYKTTTQEGTLRHAVSAQLSQSAHFSLNLPYSIFGLGRTPNFVDSLTVGMSNHSKSWTQIIPNSQMVVIPWPPYDSSSWKAQLFVTPSQLIVMSVMALTGVCGLITVIIAVLHWRERHEDKKERMSESHRFHFDAM